VVSGHAIEARLCAERPREDYRPTPGIATHVRWPEATGLRTDAAIESGSEVSASYDSLVAKVMAHGTDRLVAIGCLTRALHALEIDGLETNRFLLGAVLTDPAFRDGAAGIDYLDRRDDLRTATIADDVRHRHAAAAAFALLYDRARESLVPVPAAGWRNVGTACHVEVFTDTDGPLSIRTGGLAASAAVLVDGAWRDAGTAHVSPTSSAAETASARASTVDLTHEGVRRRYRVRVTAHGAEVNGPEGQSSFARRSEDDPEEQGGMAGECRAPLPGAIARVLVAAGDHVGDGDPLVVLEAMKMEHTLRAAGAGTVGHVLCAPGDQVDVGDVLVVIEPEPA
jgi:acetyl/propionyl-CoA carboxylase alpha subunit